MGGHPTERTLTEDGTPTVSVVIPLYNKAPHIARALDSVLAQTVQDFEVVVVDDGSTDSGGQIVASYTDSRIRLIRQENQGVSAARNRGIKEAQSDFLAFLDADDEWSPNHLESLLRLRNLFPEAGAFSTAYFHVQQGRDAFPAKIYGIPDSPWEGLFPDYFLSASMGESPVWSSAVAIPSSVFETVGLFEVGEKMGEDLDMWGRIALRYKIAFSWQGPAHYREDAEERACVLNQVEKELPFVRNVREQFNSKEIPANVRMYVGELQQHQLNSLLARGNRMDAMRVLLEIDFPSCRKYTFFSSLARIVLPKPITEILRSLKRRLEKLFTRSS